MEPITEFNRYGTKIENIIISNQERNSKVSYYVEEIEETIPALLIDVIDESHVRVLFSYSRDYKIVPVKKLIWG